jgi:thiamine-monophosphate kinase
VNLRRLGEAGFLKALLLRHRRVMPPPPAGPGDDASALGRLLFTADALLEGEHFLAREPARLIGRKALAANLSDIAAMGGVPRAFLLCLGLPERIPGRFLDDLMAGLAEAAAEHRIAWIGGDTVRSRAGIVIAITMIGERGRSLLTRGGARPGDGIFVTGPLGASAAGRALLNAGWSLGASGAVPPRGRRADRATLLRNGDLLRAHLDPEPRIAAGLFLSSRRIASAAIDVSDGLALDLHRLCDAGGTGALIHREAIPISRATRLWARKARRDPLALALGGGEDYEILFTVPRRRERLLAAWPAEEESGPIFLGRILPGREGVMLGDASGRRSRLAPSGHDPFRPRRTALRTPGPSSATPR